MSTSQSQEDKQHVEHLFEVFPWNENFNTGHETIDQQHKNLVHLLNKLANTLIEKDFSTINSAFEELAEYANYHFEQEEEIWLDYFGDDSWFSSHQLRHAGFLPKVVELKNQKEHLPTSDVVEHIIKFLIRWLAFHIIDDDKRLALVIEGMDAGLSIEEAKVQADRKMSGSMRVLIEAVLNMYEGLSTRTLELLRERTARIKAEEQLKEANKKLEALSITDQLTGLYNRRYLTSVFDNEARRARRNQSVLTFYLIDVDFFKPFNDNYGHLAGDDALSRVGECLKKLCRRPSDFAFRIGGEEFAVLSTTHCEEKARTFGEIIRLSIEDLQIPHGHSKINKYLTVSIGGISSIPDEQGALEQYMSVADERLYASKSRGRNQLTTNPLMPSDK